MFIKRMAPSFNVLLAADESFVRSLFLEIMITHGHHVVMEGCGFTAVVIGHAYPGPIHLLLADIDHGGKNKGPILAENLAYLRPRMQSVFFSVSSGTLYLVQFPGTQDEVKIPFTPGGFLELAHAHEALVPA